MKQNTDWKKELYARASQEYGTFVESLKAMTFGEMTVRIYELAVKQDILEMLWPDSSDNTLKGLADVENPLEMIYQNVLDDVTSYLDHVRKSVEQCSGKILDAQAKEFYKNPDAPMYRKSNIEALSIGEGYMWKNDLRRSTECLEQFNANVEIRDNRANLSDFLPKWVDEFGLERCKTVLAMVVKDAVHDGRYDSAVKDNAFAVATPNEDYKNLYSNIHPIVINAAYKRLMEMERSKDISKGNKDGKSAKKESRKRTEHER